MGWEEPAVPLGHQTRQDSALPRQRSECRAGPCALRDTRKGQACHASLGEDIEVTPSRDLLPPDGKACLCPDGLVPPTPQEHKADQSHGVNSGVQASLTGGEGRCQVACSSQGWGLKVCARSTETSRRKKSMDMYEKEVNTS